MFFFVIMSVGLTHVDYWIADNYREFLTNIEDPKLSTLNS